LKRFVDPKVGCR